MTSPKILLIMMVKNESRILRRAITSTLSLIDGLCILDTGSTDNTVEIANETIKELQSKNTAFIGKVYTHPFINFGVSRSKSFEVALEFLKENNWDLETTFGLLLDADMILKIDKPERVKVRLENYDSAMLYQIQHPYKYFNIRFIKMSKSWKCIGTTHEYWDAKDAPRLLMFEDNIWIDDVSDGGCKADKYERDIRLLTEGLEQNPDNSRSYFYLGQTYMCLNKPLKSIECYEKSIHGIASTETHWFALCMISRQHRLLGNIEEAERYCGIAFELKPDRSEPLYEMGMHYLSVNNMEKTKEYITKGIDIPFPQRDMIYVNNVVYNYGFKILEFEYMLRQRSKFSPSVFIEKFNKLRETNKTVFMNDLLWKFANSITKEKVIDNLCVHVAHGCMTYDPVSKHFVVFSRKDKQITELDGNTLSKISETKAPFDFDDIFSHDNCVWVAKDGKTSRLGDKFVDEAIQNAPEFISKTKPPIIEEFQRLLPVIKIDDSVVGILQTKMPKTNKSLFIYVLCSVDGIIKKFSEPFYFDDINADETCDAFCLYDSDKLLITYTSNEIQKTIITPFAFV